MAFRRFKRRRTSRYGRKKRSYGYRRSYGRKRFGKTPFAKFQNGGKKGRISVNEAMTQELPSQRNWWKYGATAGGLATLGLGALYGQHKLGNLAGQAWWAGPPIPKHGIWNDQSNRLTAFDWGPTSEEIVPDNRWMGLATDYINGEPYAKGAINNMGDTSLKSWQTYLAHNPQVHSMVLDPARALEL